MTIGADDRARTGDPNLGKVVLYQLSYVRVGASILALRLAHGPPLAPAGTKASFTPGAIG
jgi:hypothetical protein